MPNGNVKAWLLTIALSAILCALVWIAARLGVSGEVDTQERRLGRIEVLIEAHMEGHPQTVRDRINEHIADWEVHQIPHPRPRQIED